MIFHVVMGILLLVLSATLVVTIVAYLEAKDERKANYENLVSNREGRDLYEYEYRRMEHECTKSNNEVYLSTVPFMAYLQIVVYVVSGALKMRFGKTAILDTCKLVFADTIQGQFMVQDLWYVMHISEKNTECTETEFLSWIESMVDTNIIYMDNTYKIRFSTQS
jgi:nucleoside diphosphate kinase